MTYKLYDEGVISPFTLRKLTVPLDEFYDYDGAFPLSVRKSIFSYYSESLYTRWLKKNRYVKVWLDRYFYERMINGHGLGRDFIITQRESQKMVSELEISDILDDNRKQKLKVLSEEISCNIAATESCQ